MSAAEHEALDGELIDNVYESFQAIVDGLETGDESPVEHYGFDDATEMINYIQDNLELQETDIGRVLEAYENDRCPYCEEEGEVDPTLSKEDWESSQESYKVDADVRIVDHRMAHCERHEDAFLLWQKGWTE